MTIRSVSYDLKSPGRDYSTLIKAITGDFTSAIRCHYSLWLVETSRSSAEVRDLLQRHVDANDKLFVDDVNEWASWNLDVAVFEWLRKRKAA
jgi:hypothetical protein